MEIETGNENISNQSIREITTDETNGKQANQSEEGNLHQTLQQQQLQFQKIQQKLMYRQNYQEEADV